MGYYGYYGGDGMWLLLMIVVMILGLIAQSGVRRAYEKYSQMPSRAGVSAHIMAYDLLSNMGSNVHVQPIGGSLTDHFNPKTGVVSLSEGVYDSSSVAALAVAAHEIGHVAQYEGDYFPIRLRNSILPVARFGSSVAPFLVLLGFLFNSYNLAMVGVILFGAMFAFQLATLPVEFNASNRAIDMLLQGGYVSNEESEGARKVLRAAAMTYVVSALASAANLLRLLMLARRSRN